MKLIELFESKEKSLIGLTINDWPVTRKTRNEMWFGDFDCSNRQLTSLEGAPEKVSGSFYCNGNMLTSLEGAPKEVDGSFNCCDTKLTSLKGAPQKVDRNFYCSDNYLTSLKGAPKEVGGYFYCRSSKLTSLEGAPKEIGGYFDCDGNRLTSLQGIHEIITKINGAFYVTHNPIKSHVLGLLLIDGCIKVSIDNDKVSAIINKYLGKGKDGVLAAQEELIEAGLEEFAQL